MWSHLSFSNVRILPEHDNSAHVLVIGAGIIGMSTAWTLLDCGFKVTVLAKNYVNCSGNGERLTSQIAGALWEFPPAVCGHYDEKALERPQRWAMVSYHVYKRMAEEAIRSETNHTGVQMRETIYFFNHRVVDNEEQLNKMHAVECSGVSGFEHDSKFLRDFDLVKQDDWKDAYKMLCPLIDSDKALDHITKLVHAKGATFITDTIDGDLLDQESSLLDKYKAHAIVNASGIASYHLAADTSVYPLHGAILRVRNGKGFPRINQALVVSAPTTPADQTSEFVFIVPRNDEILYVGGFSAPADMPTKSAPNAWRIGEDYDNDKRIVKIRTSVAEFLSEEALDTYRVDPAFMFAEGLRPARKSGGVRLEREGRVRNGTKSRIVHCYGHAGSGWLLAFGCALEVKMLVRDILTREGKVPARHAEGVEAARL